MNREEAWELLKRINRDKHMVSEPIEQVHRGRKPRVFNVRRVMEWQYDAFEEHDMTKYLRKPYLVLFDDGSRLHVDGVE